MELLSVRFDVWAASPPVFTRNNARPPTPPYPMVEPMAEPSRLPEWRDVLIVERGWSTGAPWCAARRAITEERLRLLDAGYEWNGIVPSVPLHPSHLLGFKRDGGGGGGRRLMPCEVGSILQADGPRLAL